MSRRTYFFLAFLVFLVSAFLFLNHIDYFSTMTMRPTSIHMWAQCQRASVALNYAETSMNFFVPRLHVVGNGDGISGIEFPVVYYIAAIFYKTFGFDEIYLRSLVFFSMIIGIWYFNKLLLKYTQNIFLSLALTAAAFLSPVIVYYSNCVMPDCTSLGLALIGWYYFFVFVKERKRSQFLLFLTFAALASLVKITALIMVFVVVGLLLLDILGFFRKEESKNIFNRRDSWRYILWCAVPVLIVAAWYLYARWLSANYSNGFALSPVVVDSWEAFDTVWNEIKRNHRFEYYTYEGYVLMLAVIGFLIVSYKYVSRFLFAALVLNFIGSACFVYLMFWQFKDHDYYIISITINNFLLMLLFGDTIVRMAHVKTKFVLWIFFVVIFFNLKESVAGVKKEFNRRYDPKFVSFINDYYSFQDLEPKLRSLGIKRTDLTIAGIDNSFCNSLYLMDQLGTTYSDMTPKEELIKMVSDKRYKYLVVSDTSKFYTQYPNRLEKYAISTHRGLTIYKLPN